MKRDQFVAVPVNLMNDILQYLQDQKYREVHFLISRISQECTSVDSLSEESEALGEALTSVVEE